MELSKFHPAGPALSPLQGAATCSQCQEEAIGPFSSHAMSAMLGEVPAFGNIHQICHGSAQVYEPEDYSLYLSSHN